MSWRVWRRKKLIPGVSLGLSRSGPSLRFGVRGAGVSVGGRYGLRTTAGIPGAGVFYTTVHRRDRRPLPAARSSYTSASSSRAGAIGCLWVVGIIVGIGAAIATYGLILIPIALAVIGWIWYRRSRPDFKAPVG